MKEETKEIIRRICTHWICADEEELDRVSTELDAKIDEMVAQRLATNDRSADVRLCCSCKKREGHYTKRFKGMYCDGCYDKKLNEA